MEAPKRILVVEDEEVIAKRLIRLVSGSLSLDPEALCHKATLSQANAALAAEDIDLIFLDLNLAGEDGFDLLKQFSAKAAHTIIVSASSERAIEAFEYGVLDFIAKPFTKARIDKAIARLLGPTTDQMASAQFVTFESAKGIETVSVDEIVYFQAQDKYTEAVMKDGETRFHCKSMNRLSDVLANRFVRTHKSYLVNAQRIEAVRSLEGSRYEVILQSGTSLPVGRTRIDHVRHCLKS